MNPFDADSPILTCERDHIRHAARVIDIDLSQGHGYHDGPALPARLHRSFRIYRHDWMAYRNGAGYCPGADAVSEAVDTLGTWEPHETALVLDTVSPGDAVLDFGSQIGWFSCLAASSGASVTAIDCDPVMTALLARTCSLNNFAIDIYRHRVGPETLPLPATKIRLAKIDIEGWDAEAVRVLRPSLEARLVDFMLIEISPCFGPGYPELVDELVSYGYLVKPVPVKGTLLDEFAAPLEAMENVEPIDGSWVHSVHQADVWVMRA